MRKKLALFVLYIVIISACAPTATATEETAAQPSAQATEPAVVETPTLVPTKQPALQAGEVYTYIDGTKLAAIPAGEFTMGGNGNDNPEHPVTLNDYWVFSTLVTNQQYTVCVQIGKCTPPDLTDNPGYGNVQNANDPVTGVTYEQAVNYCTFAGGRLPSEAEWEKAANGAPDMLGSISEWISDWYDPAYYKNSPSENPSGPENGTAHIVRSGSELDHEPQFRKPAGASF
ncbi:MAG: SUMF1/EgtB/PvdO family nonheme iron enzyme [Anaerolineales bacterium]